MTNTPEMVAARTRAARLLAVEVLLADPETLYDDVLESCLYILRERLNDNENDGDQKRATSDIT